MSVNLKHNIAVAVFWGFIALSVLIRFININSPLCEDHMFRQTQTAITIHYFVKDGIKLLNYETPLFGPPWKVPFEFPAFQATAALFAMGGISNSDTACRATNIFYFYVSAVFLYLVSKQFFSEKPLPVFILFYYLYNPYTIYWSRTCLIDYASAAFSLGYFFFTIIFFKNTTKIYCVVFAVIFGTLAYLTKITTVPVFFPLISGTVAYMLYKRLRVDSNCIVGNFIKENKKIIALLIILFAVPFICGYLWVHYTDYVKNSSLFTSFNSSTNLFQWNYGTFSQRLTLKNWLNIFNYFYLMAPGVLVLSAAAGCRFIWRRKGKYALFFILSFLGIILVPFTFFNLYMIHEYYSIALSALVAVVMGISLYAFFYEFIGTSKVAVLACILVFTLTSLPVAIQKLRLPLFQMRYPPKNTLTDFIKTITNDNEYLIITDFSWSSRILYYSNRKGFMVHDKYVPEMGAFFKKHNFTTIISREPDPALLTNWKYIIEIKTKLYDTRKFRIFKVTDNPEILNNWHVMGY
ncbi:MAG: hypothetical protein H7844_06510 [Nitrospirae bacterium YQR-1]